MPTNAVTITLGPNSFAYTGDGSIDEFIVELFRSWVNAQQEDGASPAALDAATARLKAANTKLAATVDVNTTTP